jgi:hypothetical protein
MGEAYYWDDCVKQMINKLEKLGVCLNQIQSISCYNTDITATSNAMIVAYYCKQLPVDSPVVSLETLNY